MNYSITGWSSYTAKASLNSAHVTSLGHKLLTFKDGHQIKFNNFDDSVSNLLFGSVGHAIVGQMTFEDTRNNIVATFKFGNVRGKPHDYFSGQILRDGESVSTIHGNYMGYIDFDGVRYYDVREKHAVSFPVYAKGPLSLPSDSTKRKDTVQLRTGDVESA